MIKVYVDTSVFGGCFDEEFREWSRKLLDEFKSGLKILVLSDLTLKELEEAPTNVRNVVGEVPEGHKVYILLDEEARALARHYIDEEVVSASYLLDAQHIALATVKRVDVLVSWNFKHIVNLDKIRRYNAVNLKYGYPLLEIRSPREVLSV
jgi:predicted nucleic acid-binding protein